MKISELWAYDKERRMDKKGKRWHFLRHDLPYQDVEYEDAGFELFFRDDDRKIYGVLRFEKKKDNPYRDYKTMINKIMNNEEFRDPLLDLSTKFVWRKNWK